MSDAAHPRPVLHTSKASWKSSTVSAMVTNFASPHRRSWLYPALHRLEQQGWLRAEWKDSDLGRPAKVYSLTRAGRKQLDRELDSWNRLSSAVQLLIETA